MVGNKNSGRKKKVVVDEDVPALPVQEKKKLGRPKRTQVIESVSEVSIGDLNEDPPPVARTEPRES